jgi:hypothetical protein
MSVNIPNQGYGAVTPPQESKPLVPKWAVVVGIVVSLLLLVGSIVLVVWLARSYPNQIEAVRDIFIIVFAAAACSTIIVLLLLLVAVIRLINMLEFEIKPILEKTNETMSMVQGTTTFVSTNVVKPAITASSYFSGIRQGIKVLFGDSRRNLPD